MANGTRRPLFPEVWTWNATLCAELLSFRATERKLGENKGLARVAVASLRGRWLLLR